MNPHDHNWSESNPLCELHRRRELRWARLVLAAKFALALFAFSLLLKGFGIMLIALKP